MWDSLSEHIGNVLRQSTLASGSAIFDYAKSSFTEYPAITYCPADGDGEFADTTRNKRNYIFSIKCYQERTEMTEQTSEQTLRNLIDELITLFDSQTYLDGDFLHGRGWVKPIPSTWAFIQGEQINMRVAEILIGCVVIQ